MDDLTAERFDRLISALDRVADSIAMAQQQWSGVELMVASFAKSIELIEGYAHSIALDADATRKAVDSIEAALP